MVVHPHATEPLSAFDLTGDGTDSFLRLDELVAQTLMISLGMIVLNEIGNSSLKWTMAENVISGWGKPTFGVPQITEIGPRQFRVPDHLSDLT